MSKILVVDDNEDNLYMLRSLLSGSGYEVETAADGAAALEAARIDTPAVIVSDILMPVMDGFMLCRHWKSDKELTQVPFVFYTATYTGSQDENFALELGADRFVRKPADPDAFLAMIREVIEKQGDTEASMRPQPPVTEEVHLRQYNQVLLRKLEDKMEELEQANRLLEQRVIDRTAELEERNQTLEAFAYSMAHDLGAPLRGIRGFADILKSDEAEALSNVGREHLDVIIESSDRLQQMMSDLLRYATMGRGGLGTGPVELAHVMQRVQDDLKVRINEAKPQLTIAEDLPSVIGERTLLNQVFANLVSNAILYCRKGETPQVDISWQGRGDKVVVAVKDNGIGIRAKEIEHIFSLFRRLNTQEEYAGSGVGLGIVERGVRLLGGRVWVESEFGQGSTFFVELLATTHQAATA